jgi:hypothetical protein
MFEGRGGNDGGREVKPGGCGAWRLCHHSACQLHCGTDKGLHGDMVLRPETDT